MSGFSRLRRQDPEGRQPLGAASRAAGRFPDAGELENRPPAQSGIAAEPSCRRRRGDRMKMLRAAAHESLIGTFADVP
jgi:hypothetical protein